MRFGTLRGVVSDVRNLFGNLERCAPHELDGVPRCAVLFACSITAVCLLPLQLLHSKKMSWRILGGLELGPYASKIFPMSGPSDTSGLDVSADRPLDIILKEDGSPLAGTAFANALMNAAEFEARLPVELARRLMDEEHAEGLPLAPRKVNHEPKRPRLEEAKPQRRNTADKWAKHFASLLVWGILGLAAMAVDANTGTPVTTSILFFSTYFAVPKGEDKARAIFSGAKVSAMFMSPPPTNLFGIHEFLRECS